jgi:hypothetical protein
MTDTGTKIRWGVERRLEFIEFRIFWEGGVRRADLISTFGVSEPQASKDLTLYQEMAPGNMVYDKVSKRYVAASGFAPVFLKQGPADYFIRLRSIGEGLSEPGETWLGAPPEVDVVLTPARDVDVECLRPILEAVRERRSIDIRYQSMGKDRPEPIWRRVTPHAFGYDGFRWHARAWCHRTEKFKDFLIPRILGVGEIGDAGLDGSHDASWNERFGVVIGPHPDLAESQQAIVAKDYGMVCGSKTLDVRYAMLFYALKRLGLLEDAREKPARTQHIVLLNAEETAEALKKADWSL